MSKTVEQMNQEAHKAQLEKQDRFRKAKFTELSSKHLAYKLDIFQNDFDNFVQNVSNRLKTAEGLVENQRIQQSINRFLKLELIKSGAYADMESLSARLEEIVNEDSGLRVLTTEEPVRVQDRVTVDAIGFREGNADPNMSVHNHTFDLNYMNFIPDFEKAFIGMKVGETKEVDNVTFPPDYQAPALAGKSFKYQFKLIKAKRSIKLEEQLKEVEENTRQAYLKAITDMGFDTTQAQTLSLDALKTEAQRLRQVYNQQGPPTPAQPQG